MKNNSIKIASKEEERQALKKIRNIVDKLGENSYIKTAFDGAFELAEGNIEDDAAFSARWYIDKVHLLQKDVSCYEARIKESKAIKEQMAKEIDGHKVTIKNQEDEITELMMKITSDSKESIVQINTLTNEIKTLTNEITVLKAKLYDYFTQNVVDQLINN